MSRKHTKTCTWCKKRLDYEEVESPHLSEDNEVLCDDCYDEKYRRICPLCEEYYEDSKTVEDGFYYMIIEKREGSDTIGKSLQRGIYQIIQFPFFADGMIEGHYFSRAFKKLRILTKEEKEKIKKEEIKDNEICKDCVNEVTERASSHS